MVRYYVAILEPAAPGFMVFFPDVGGCTSAGATLQEAAMNAEVALQAHLELLLEGGDALPEARAMEAIAVDPQIEEAARFLVRFEIPGRAVRVNISLPEELLARVDRFASSHGYTRSGLLAQAAREHLRVDN